MTAVKKPKISLFFPVFMIVACPYIAGTLSLLLGVSPSLSLAIALAIAAPPASGNAAVARMLGLSPSLSLVTTIASMLLAPFTAPLILKIFDPTSSITLDPYGLALRLITLLASCIAITVVLRRIAKEKIIKNRIAIDGIVICALLIFACGTMSDMQALIINEPQVVLSTIFLAYAINTTLQIAGFIAFPGNLNDRLTMALTCGNRNIGLLWAVLGTSITPSIALFFACSQLPIYTMPKIIHFVFSRIKRLTP
ncbi:hypothetical protein [Pseudomonas sp. BIGb0164]|uniref:hypothetical protein n=1 Tax=Pseudomonas sp. BIGb0164 TaxID=2940605 RepID=UPI00216866B6|nr:hypothetical protein [Pseudomonas sp. BIGb0164]MCS4249426.1 BASS family bile acid:Na+ symporter [Pseudomonas sp. BIGb0164]